MNLLDELISPHFISRHPETQRENVFNQSGLCPAFPNQIRAEAKVTLSYVLFFTNCESSFNKHFGAPKPSAKAKTVQV